MTCDERPRRAFTLVELLVVIAIISVLAALAVPAYNRSTRTTQSVGCLSNLRQLGVALSAYLNDHAMTMPPLRALRTSTSDNVPVIDNTLNVYAASPKVFACPADNLGLAASTGTSYYWNLILSGQRLGNLSFIDVQNASQIPILVDKSGFHPNAQFQVNLLYADGHATNGLNFYTSTSGN